MKWILCGKNDAGVECLEFLVGHGDEVWVVGTAGDDGIDRWQRSLRRAAVRLGVRFDQPPRINDPGFVARLAAFGADALFSIQYDQILRNPLFESIGCPSLNLHFALLPRHRGVAPIAWALVEGDREAGVTLHHMIEDIDAGAVVAQRRVPIDPTDTARELYDKVSAATVTLFREQYPFPPAVLETRVAQDAARACYHRAGDFDFSHRRIDWQRPAGELHRWIRAMIFPPLQHPETVAAGRRLGVARLAAGPGAAAPAAAGTVVGRFADGIQVAAGGGTIGITEMIDPGNPATPSGEILRSIGVGDRLS
jgi:UDP-4-amino-4-deoxy-L-arabinose formyltransferase/UDP-glucuronic acid dehydrogenase (UDP-4-keto-hexauronic acid decarboxylating)